MAKKVKKVSKRVAYLLWSAIDSDGCLLIKGLRSSDTTMTKLACAIQNLTGCNKSDAISVARIAYGRLGLTPFYP
jgi:hypothetical protein